MIKTEWKSFTSTEEFFERVGGLIEESNQATPFLSLFWLSSWLKSIAKVPPTLLFYKNGELIGVVIIGKGALHKSIPVFKKFLCNQSGVEQEDQVWIEYNQIICNEIDRPECFSALLSEFLRKPSVIALDLSMVFDSEKLIDVLEVNKIKYESDVHRGYKRTLIPDSSIDTLIGSLSKSTRVQLRRSLRKAEKLWGDLSVEVTRPCHHQVAFKKLSALHKKRWETTSEGSGFDNPCFIKHHQNMIINHPEAIDLLIVTAGEHLLGVCYFILNKDQALFYCGGINEAVPDKHIKPGYLVHVACMVNYSKRGFNQYDFLAGKAQYKKSLSNLEYELCSLRIWNSSFRARIIRGLIYFKRKLSALLSKPSPDSPQQ